MIKVIVPAALTNRVSRNMRSSTPKLLCNGVRKTNSLSHLKFFHAHYHRFVSFFVTLTDSVSHSNTIMYSFKHSFCYSLPSVCWCIIINIICISSSIVLLQCSIVFLSVDKLFSLSIYVKCALLFFHLFFNPTAQTVFGLCQRHSMILQLFYLCVKLS